MTKLIWQLIDSSSVGGIETHVVHLSRTLKKSGINNHIVRIKRYGEHPVFDAQENSDLSVLCCLGIRDVIRQCHEVQPDVIHAHGSKACLIAKYLRLITQQKIICTYHTGETGKGWQGVYDRLNQWTASIGAAIAVSDPIANKLIGKSSRINNFIPIPDTTAARNGQQAFGFVGRLSQEKGPDRFVQLAHDHKKNDFVMYGCGDLLATIKATAPENLRLHTKVSSMDNYWHTIKLLCITSREEGLPLVALEAMARGVCVVTFSVGGLPSLIKDGVNGFLIPSQSMDAMNNFIGCFNDLSVEEIKSIQSNAKKTIFERYSTNQLVPQITEIYGALGREK